MALIQNEPRPYRWVVIVSWIFCHGNAWAIVLVTGMLLPSISTEFRLSFTQQGLLSSIPVWASVVLTLPLAVWLVRFSPSILTTVTLALGTAFLFLQASANTFGILLIARLAFGVTIAAREPTRVRLMQQWFPDREFFLVNGVTAGILSFVVALVLIITPFLVSTLGEDWRPTLYISGGFFAFLTILWAILGRERAVEYQLTFPNMKTSLLRGVLHHKELWAAGLGFFGTNLAQGGFLAFYPTAMLADFDFPLIFSGIILALNLGVSGLACFIISRITTDWKSRAKILYLFGLVMPGTYILLLLTDSFPLLLITAAVNGLTWGFFPILLTVTFYLKDIRRQEVSVGHGFLLSAVSLGVATGPLLTGFLQDTFDNLQVVLMAISLISSSLLIAGVFVGRLRDVPTPEI
jgi:cyanate permease